MKQTEHEKYEQEVISLLRDKILFANKFAEIQTGYIFKNEYSPSIRLDFVVLDSYKRIKEVYYICSPTTYYGHYYTLREKLSRYNQFIEVGYDNFFLAFIDKKRELQTVSLRSLETDKKDNEQHTATVASFIKFYSTIKNWAGEFDSDESSLFFRGLSKTSFVALPSVYRDNSLIGNENRLFHEAIRRNPNEFPDDMSTFDKLVKMQHYELPTRLLDITTNPLVALYFACKENFKSNGSVLVYPILKEDIQYYDSELISILANLSKRSISFKQDETSDEWIEFKRDVEKESPNVSDKIIRYNISSTLCVLPKLNNNRIVNQDGAFFIFGIDYTKDKPASLPDQPYVINIMAKAKQKILAELDFLGINEASLFPETDKAMHQIKEEYCSQVKKD